MLKLVPRRAWVVIARSNLQIAKCAFHSAPASMRFLDIPRAPSSALPRRLSPLLEQLARRLFDVEVVPADGEAPIWNSDVRFFKVRRGHWI